MLDAYVVGWNDRGLRKMTADYCRYVCRLACSEQDYNKVKEMKRNKKEDFDGER